MVNNFKLIKEHIDECAENETFYWVQIIKRKKGNPDYPRSENIIKDYFLSGPTHLGDKKEEITAICDALNARAYIHMTKRIYEKAAFRAMMIIASSLESRQYHSAKDIFIKAISNYAFYGQKWWVVDIDNNQNSEFILEISNVIKDITNDNSVVKISVPTKTGYHLITEPFNKQAFKREYPDIDIHTNNPTLLYMP